MTFVPWDQINERYSSKRDAKVPKEAEITGTNFIFFKSYFYSQSTFYLKIEVRKSFVTMRKDGFLYLFLVTLISNAVI